MIIDISDDFRIRRHDRFNFVVEELVTVQPKDETKPSRQDWRICGHYGSIASAFRGLPEALSFSESVTTYKEFLSRWDALIKGRTA